MPPLPEDEKKKKINTSPYLMTGTSPENKGFGISPVMQDAFSRRPDRSFADTAGAETYDTAAIAKQQQPREVSTTGQAIAAQMAGAPYKQPEQDVAPVGGLPKPAAAPATTPSAPAAPDATGNPGNYGALVGNATRGLFSPEGSISFDPKTKTYSGRELRRRVSYEMRTHDHLVPGVEPSYVVLGLEPALPLRVRFLTDSSSVRLVDYDANDAELYDATVDATQLVDPDDRQPSDAHAMAVGFVRGLDYARLALGLPETEVDHVDADEV